MNSLLNVAIQAHGGLARWSEFTDLVTDVEVEGKLCKENDWSGMVPRSRLLISLCNLRMIVLLPEEQGRIIVQAGLIDYHDGLGSDLRSLAHPRETMLQEDFGGGHWDSLRVAYFISHAVRHSLTAPFLYRLPGFVVEEIEPWAEDGELWRVLKVKFPPDFGSPTPIHLAYYGPDGRLRRTRNGAPMIGKRDLAEYVTSYQDIDGIWLPGSKEVFACDSDGRKQGHASLARFQFSEPFLTS